MKKKSMGLLVVLAVIFGLPSFSFGEDVKLLFPAVKLEEKKLTDGKIIYLRKYSVDAEPSWWKPTGKKPDEVAKKIKVVGYVQMLLSEFAKQFKGKKYMVDKIELWVEAKAAAGWIVSFEGKGGCKVTIVPVKSKQEKPKTK